MKESEKTLSLFLEVGRVIRSRMGKVLPLSFGQFELLHFTHDVHDPLMRDVASHFKIAAPSATSLVNELVQGGYLIRKASTEDRREIRISLTNKGRQILKKVEGQRKKLLEELLSPLTARDRRDFNRILSTILNHI